MLEQIFARLGIRADPDEDSYEPPERGGVQTRYMTETGRHIMVTRPTSVAQMDRIAATAQEDISIILCLEGAAPEMRQRILDYCLGLCAGLKIYLQQIASQAYLLSPETVALEGQEFYTSSFVPDEHLV